MPVNVIYTTSAIASGGRDGHAATTDGSLDVKLARPKELGGKGGVASQGGPKVPANAEVQATVGLGPRSEGGFGLEIALDVTLPGLVRGETQALIEKAHQVCPYSNATRNNVAVKLSLTEM